MIKLNGNLNNLLGFPFFLLALTALAHAGPPIHVPEDHASIQAAVDAAGPGDHILIGPGVYDENVIVDVDGVRLIAREGLHTVVIDGTDLEGDGTGVDGIHVVADSVVLQHLVVRNFNAYVGPGIVDFRVGILVDGCEHCKILENLARSNGDGIVLRGAVDSMVEGNIARNNIHNGLFLRNESHSNKVKDNVGLDNGPNMNPAPDFVPAGIGCGIQLSFDSNGNDINANNLSGNGRGVQLDRGSTNNEVKNNVSTNNARFGIAALAVGGQPAASGNIIKGNTSLANGEFDLIDQGDPVGNIWKNNTFETRNF